MEHCCDEKYFFRGKEYKCSLNLAMDIIGGKWKILILWHLSKGTLRFAELKKLLPGISKKVLTESLRNLEEYDLVKRKVYPEVPPKVEYSISVIGQKLLPALSELAEWGQNISEKNY